MDAAVNRGTCPIHLALAIVLFDSRITHTFIAKTLVNRIGVLVDELGYDLLMSTPAGVVLTIGVCEGCSCHYPTTYPFDYFSNGRDEGIQCYIWHGLDDQALSVDRMSEKEGAMSQEECENMYSGQRER